MKEVGIVIRRTLGTSVRLMSLRLRLVRQGLIDFRRTMETLDRLEGWSKRLRSAALVDAVIAIRHEVISQIAESVE